MEWVCSKTFRRYSSPHLTVNNHNLPTGLIVKRIRVLAALAGIVFCLAGLIGGAVYFYYEATSVSEISRPGDFQIGSSPVSSQPVWSTWRGKNYVANDPYGERDFIIDHQDPAVTFLAIPGRGHSTPVEINGQLVLTTSSVSEQTQSVIAVSQDCSRILWSRNLHRGGLPEIHEHNSHASASIAGDGQRVFTAFLNENQIFVSGLDSSGSVLWQKSAGPYFPEWGFGSTPIAHGGLVIVVGENVSDGIASARTSGFITAFDATNGEIVWRIQREHRSYGSPTLIEQEDRSLLILASTGKISAFDIANGSLVWSADWSALRTANGICLYEDSVIASCASLGTKEIVRVRFKGEGDVTNSEVAWRFTRNPGDVPTPVAASGLVFFVSDQGVGTCLDAESGKKVWQVRLGGNFFSSPVLSGQQLFVINRSGQIFTFELNREKPSVTRGSVSGEVYASPILIESGMVVRSSEGLYLFPLRAEEPSAS